MKAAKTAMNPLTECTAAPAVANPVPVGAAAAAVLDPTVVPDPTVAVPRVNVVGTRVLIPDSPAIVPGVSVVGTGVPETPAAEPASSGPVPDGPPSSGELPDCKDEAPDCVTPATGDPVTADEVSTTSDPPVPVAAKLTLSPAPGVALGPFCVRTPEWR